MTPSAGTRSARGRSDIHPLSGDAAAVFRMARDLWGCALALAVLALSSPASAGAEDPPAPPGTPPAAPAADDRPTYIILQAPEDIPELLRRLDRPDFVIRKGAEDAPDSAPAATPLEATGVTRVEVSGAVRDELADLTVALEISAAAAPEPAWVPIRLDGLNITGAEEAGRSLPLRVAEGGGWQVEVRGRGEHQLRIQVLVPVATTAERRSLTMAIPEAPSTRVLLDVPQRVAGALAGARDPLALESLDSGTTTRLSAHLPPRDKLEISWRVGTEPAPPPAPLIAAQGEIAIDVAPDSFRAVSSWTVSSKRGTASSLQVRLDPADELLGLKLDGQPLPMDGTTDDGAAVLEIPLSEPLRPGATRRLDVTTRRPLTPGTSSRLIYAGLPFLGSAEQTGVVAIAQSGDLWIFETPGRGLRQIDPRELPGDLRARPATVLAYRFADQPFELDLRIDPSPPRIRVSSRATVTLDAGRAQVDAWLDYQVTRGRAFEVRVGLPEGLVLETAGPDEVVAAAQGPSRAPDDPDAGPPVLILRLTAKARDDGTFRIHLTGRHSYTAPAAAIPLFQPLDGTIGSREVVVVAARQVGVELADEAQEGPQFVAAGPAPPADWPWPSPRPEGAPAGALWLRSDLGAVVLPVWVVAQPRTVHHQATLTARIERDHLELRQEITCHVRHGALTTLDIAVPAALAARWDLEGAEVSSREPLDPGPDGAARWRLVLGRAVANALTLRFLSRIPLDRGLVPDRATPVTLPMIGVSEGIEAPSRIRVAADSGIGLAPKGSGWIRTSGQETAPERAGEPPPRFTKVLPPGEPGLPVVVATALPLAPLPLLVAPRLWLRTVQGHDGSLQTSAWYGVEVHEETLAVALPQGATLVRAQVDGRTVTAVERLTRPEGYRLRLPSGATTAPALVGLEYTVPAADADAGWDPPRLLEGGLVQQTLWEIWVTGSRAVVGVPPGWTDENRWYWDTYVWKRRPWNDAEGLASWLAGSASRPLLAAAGADVGRSGSHGYLFGRTDEPTRLRPAIVSRAGLVGVCSGAVLGLGLVGLVWRPRGGWIVLAVLAFVVIVAAAVQPGLVLPALQSSAVGAVLVPVAGLMHRLLQRRRPGPARFGEPGGITIVSPSNSSAGVMVGSDDSTAIRPRPGTTIEHARASLPIDRDSGVIEIHAPGPDS